MKHRTRKSAAKRFKVTKTGKVLHRSQGIRHLKSKKTKRQLRSLKQMNQVHGKAEKKIKKMLGIG
jgi:large subunit ribosomal protein L35